jgi:hypothetical protein
MASISDQWSAVQWNHSLGAEDLQQRNHSGRKTVNIDFSAPIVWRTRSGSSSSRRNQHPFEKFLHNTQNSPPV